MKIFTRASACLLILFFPPCIYPKTSSYYLFLIHKNPSTHPVSQPSRLCEWEKSDWAEPTREKINAANDVAAQIDCLTRSCRLWTEISPEKFSELLGKQIIQFSEKSKVKYKVLKSIKLASIKPQQQLMPVIGLTIKTEYNLSEESSSSSSNSSPTMVETASSPLIRSKITSARLSPTTNSFINSKMLLTHQNISYMERLASRGGCDDNKKSESFSNTEKHLNGNSTASSLFTIDSILSKQTQRYSDSSPSSSPSHEPSSASTNLSFKNGFNIDSSPSRIAANRLPPSNLFQNHPGLHITHLAANFGSPDFLGKFS